MWLRAPWTKGPDMRAREPESPRAREPESPRVSMSHEASAKSWHDRRRATLEQLLALEGLDLDGGLDESAQIVVGALGADKVDAFIHEAKTESLVARGTS